MDESTAPDALAPMPPPMPPLAAVDPLVPPRPAALEPTEAAGPAESPEPAEAAGPAAAAAGRPKAAAAGMNGGRWTEEEHQSFLAGLRLYGREWKKVASKIRTRTSAQIRSHAQKYFAKLARDDELRRHGAGPGTGAGAGAGVGAGAFGYFSDGGSSAAPNSGDEDAADADARPAVDAVARGPRRPLPKRLAPAPALALVATPAPAPALPTGATKRARSRSRSRSPRGERVAKHPRRAALARLPSQEELLAKASPNVRRRLASLIEAELCALQVLSCHALLRPRGLRAAASSSSAAAAVSSAGRAPRLAPPALGLAMISTEQPPPASSIC